MKMLAKMTFCALLAMTTGCTGQAYAPIHRGDSTLDALYGDKELQDITLARLEKQKAYQSDNAAGYAAGETADVTPFAAKVHALGAGESFQYRYDVVSTTDAELMKNSAYYNGFARALGERLHAEATLSFASGCEEDNCTVVFRPLGS